MGLIRAGSKGLMAGYTGGLAARDGLGGRGLLAPSLAALIRALFRNGEAGAWLDPSDATTLFQDAAGTTPAGIGDPVRLALDKSKGLVLGPELVTNGGFDSDTDWTKGTGWSISDNLAKATSAPSGAFITQDAGLSIGKFYEVVVDIAFISEGGIRPFAGNNGAYGATVFTSGVYTWKLLAEGTTGSIHIAAAGTTTAEINSVSVRELPGNHALAPSDAARPVVVEVDGNIALRRDLIDDQLDVTLPAITNGKIIIGTTQGVWVDDLNFAGGTFSLGPTTYTGGPTGLYEAIGADELGTIILDRQPATAELATIMKWFESKGSPDNLITEPF